MALWILQPGDLRVLGTFIDQATISFEDRGDICTRALAPLRSADPIVSNWAETGHQIHEIRLNVPPWRCEGVFTPGSGAHNNHPGPGFEVEAGTWSIVRIWNTQTGQSFGSA